MNHDPVARSTSGTRRRIPVVLGGLLGALLGAVGILTGLCGAAAATALPTVTSLSGHSGPYWGGTQLVVEGSGFTGASRVTFGTADGYAVHVVSPTRLIVGVPWHDQYSTVHVRVLTPAGFSPRTDADRYTFVRPTPDDPIMGGLTAHQEQRISAQVRAAHRNARVARGSRWSPALAATAVSRARSWLGLPTRGPAAPDAARRSGSARTTAATSTATSAGSTAPA
ncbi:MAG: IPT/TIG domain-containing protein [Jatrophihabitans sp.]|uniref:IPT/TIG domain-containing protein n=1 Tax=Jatrophihabitans sp. TaxID=1932789 RepID=UPI003F7DC888